MPRNKGIKHRNYYMLVIGMCTLEPATRPAEADHTINPINPAKLGRQARMNATITFGDWRNEGRRMEFNLSYNQSLRDTRDKARFPKPHNLCFMSYVLERTSAG